MSTANVKFAKKRLEILRTAAAAFRHHGYYGASVDDIARALHMRKGNLYYYFQNKEEILYFCHDYSLDLLLRVLREVESSDAPPEKKLHRLIVAFVHIVLDELNGTGLTLDLVALSPPRLKKIIAKRDRFDRGVRRIVKSGMDAGVFLPRDPKLLTFAIFGVVNWIPRWFNPQGPANSAEISQTFAHYLLTGLMNAAPSGEQP
ncbi:MAG: TetR/AcrR family transcriptional regulator [Candidatus Acidiferrales bacterium]